MGEIVDLERYRSRRRRKALESRGAAGRRSGEPRKPRNTRPLTVAESGEGGRPGADGAAKVEREDHKAE